MRRREFISLLGGGVATWPLAARGQHAGRLRRIGIIVGGGPAPAFAGFAQGMQKLGYVEGRDFAVEWRFAEGNYERHREFAADLVRHCRTHDLGASGCTAGNFDHTNHSCLLGRPGRAT